MSVIESRASWLLRPGRRLLTLAAVAGPMLAVAASATVQSASEDLRPALKAAARDPFLMPVLAPPAPAQPAFVPPPPVLAAPVMPSEPVLQLSFTGRMQTPDGRTVVLAQWSDGRAVTLEPGKVLSNGYRVERMSAGLIELIHPQTQAVVQLPLPPAPRFETR